MIRVLRERMTEFGFGMMCIIITCAVIGGVLAVGFGSIATLLWLLSGFKLAHDAEPWIQITTMILAMSFWIWLLGYNINKET